MRRSAARLESALLAFDRFARPATSDAGVKRPAVVFLHGIFGNKRNWHQIAKTCVQIEAPTSVAPAGLEAYCVDHRGHGASLADEDSDATVQGAAADVMALLDNLGVAPYAVCGHSFGGKVSLAYLKRCRELGRPVPEVTFVLDALPGYYDLETDRHDPRSLYRLVDTLLRAPDSYPSRQAAASYLAAQGVGEGVVAWLVAGLVPCEQDDAKVRLSFHLDHAHKLLQDFCGQDFWPTVQAAAAAPQGRLVFVRAGQNPVWTEEAVGRLQALEASSGQRVRLATIPHVGHWLHADDPVALLQLLDRELF